MIIAVPCRRVVASFRRNWPRSDEYDFRGEWEPVVTLTDGAEWLIGVETGEVDWVLGVVAPMLDAVAPSGTLPTRVSRSRRKPFRYPG